MTEYINFVLGIFALTFQEISKSDFGMLIIGVMIFCVVIGLWEGAVKIMSKR